MHEIACLLQPRQEIREPFARGLATLVRDSQRDETTRDYAIQHLRQLWSRAANDPSLRASIVATFREFTALDPAVSTSALLSLHLLGSPFDHAGVSRDPSAGAEMTANPTGPGKPPASFQVPDSDLVPLLQPIFAATTSAGNIPARLTAVRIVGERRMTDFRAPLLATLKNPSEHTLVRMAAANALGKIADPADLEILASIDPGDVRVAAALHYALRSRASR